jgi:hypothetical protein
MTGARIEEVPADRVTVREFLAQGRVFFDDALTDLSNESRHVNASYEATPVAGAGVDDAAEATRELYALTEELLRR